MEALLEANERGDVYGLDAVSGVRPRLDIDQLLHEKPDTFNLFLLALKELQEDPDHNKLMGYFQVAGIHGLPKATWRDVKWRDKDESSSSDSGYCAHGTLTFATWHRPYLVMLEQTLFVKMYEIALKFSPAYKYIKAVMDFRLPYWDYFRPRDFRIEFPGINGRRDKHGNLDPKDPGFTSYPYDFGVPQILTLEKVIVQLPGGRSKLEENPLRTYWFPLGEVIPEKQWAAMQLNKDAFSRGHTVRNVLSAFNSPYQGSNVRMNQAVNKAREEKLSALTDLLFKDSSYDEYETFSYSGESGLPGSLEATIHNAYHVRLGDGGHMGEVPVAAFDPIFWLHHCNIDRYLAIWQDIHPDRWFRAKSSQKALQDDLLPFFCPPGKDGKQFWTSKTCQFTTNFGYTYSEVKGSPNATINNFQDLYSWSLRPQPEPPLWQPKPPLSMTPLDLSDAKVFKGHPEYIPPRSVHTMAAKFETLSVQSLKAVPPPVSSVQVREDTQTATQDRAWFVNDEVERMARNGSFNIDYFIGPKGGAIEVSPDQWAVAPTLAGSTYIFASPVEVCDNCGVQEEQAHIVTDTISLTPMLMDYIKVGALASLEPGDVKPFLVDRLRWRVRLSNSDVIDPRSLPGFKVSVISKVYPLSTESGTPAIESYPEITDQILGNASEQAGHLTEML